ncbi:hypothetical protein DL240_10255 [Lujinxingia litoralis]|uniref:Uncharacterized protein n=2 Tax=Lujinxingia litoralis TaxID=2211119 RepID=A0A328C5D9_9DELT|nr:hypothetical protein DL240_10255 [Lujinxingia litoralis]
MVVLLCVGLLSCGGSYDEPDPGGSDDHTGAGEDSDMGGEPGAPDPQPEPEPEIEEAIVERVAATERYIFVPGGREGGDQIALIDGETFAVEPIQVGLNPRAVVAAEVAGVGAVAYVWSEGTSTVAVVRADLRDAAERPDVRVLRVPREVNQLAVAPGGRYALAYIDPELELPVQGGAISLQAMALIALGDAPGEDQVYRLSVTRQIESIRFSEDGRFGFVVGEEGISRLAFDEIKADRFVPTLDLGASNEDFPPRDQQALFTADASAMVLRTSQLAGLGVFELSEEGQAVRREQRVLLPGVPTDMELLERDVEGGLRREVLVAMRQVGQVARFDLDAVLAAQDEQEVSGLVELIALADEVDAGIARLTPDESQLLIFSTLPAEPTVGVLELESAELKTVRLRHQIRTLAFSPDSRTAVVVHRPKSGVPPADADPRERFEYEEGLSLWDLASGYVRAVALEAQPQTVLMVTTRAGAGWLYGMLVGEEADNFGVVRISLETFGVERLSVAQRPAQIGRVADQIFVTQNDARGRVTFFSIEDGTQRTVSGFELNAEIQ